MYVSKLKYVQKPHGKERRMPKHKHFFKITNGNANWLIDTNKSNNRTGDSCLIIASNHYSGKCAQNYHFLKLSSGHSLVKFNAVKIVNWIFLLKRWNNCATWMAYVELKCYGFDMQCFFRHTTMGSLKKKTTRQSKLNIVCTTPAHWLRFVAQK